MRYVAPESGFLPADLDETDSSIDEIMETVVQDTREFYELPEPMQQLLLQAVRKAAVLGLEEGAESAVLDAEEEEALLDIVIEETGLSIDSPYVTFHDVRRTATKAIALTLGAVEGGIVRHIDEI